jgi:hypothetical protein
MTGTGKKCLQGNKSTYRKAKQHTTTPKETRSGKATKSMFNALRFWQKKESV